MKTARQIALDTLFGKEIPDQRWAPKTTLQRLGAKYPDLMGSVAEHAAARLTEFGDDVTEGQLLLIQKEAESIGLQSAVALQMIDEGLTNEEGKPHPMFGVYLRLNEQVLKILTTLGIDPIKKTSNGKPEADALAAWNKALQTTGNATTAPSSSLSADADTDTDDNAGQMTACASEEGGDE